MTDGPYIEAKEIIVSFGVIARGRLRGGFPTVAPCNPRPNSVPYRCEMHVRDMSPSAEALV